jgi:hypothetical protein
MPELAYIFVCQTQTKTQTFSLSVSLASSISFSTESRVEQTGHDFLFFLCFLFLFVPVSPESRVEHTGHELGVVRTRPPPHAPLPPPGAAVCVRSMPRSPISVCVWRVYVSTYSRSLLPP